MSVRDRGINSRVADLRVAHASRVLVGASRADELLFAGSTRVQLRCFKKACFGETPKPPRETRALPG